MKNYTALEALAEKSGRFNDVLVRIGTETVSLRSAYGLWLKKAQPEIGAPEVEGLLEYPPGYDFVYNFTQAVDGKVHFNSRSVTMAFLCILPKNQWDSIRGELESALQGQWLEFYFSKTPDIRYIGLFEVELTPGTDSAEVTITVTCTA